MKSVCVTFLSLFATFSYADLNKGLIYHADWVQHKLDSGKQCFDTSVGLNAQNNEVAELCMTQVCGPAEKVNTAEEKSVLLMRDPQLQKIIQPNANEMAEAINTLLDEAPKNKLQVIEGYRELQKANDLIPNPEYMRLHDRTTLMNELVRSSIQPGPDSKQPWILDKEKTYKALTDLSDEQRKWVVDGIDRFLRSPVGAEYILINTNQPKVFLKLKYPNLSFKDALKAQGLKTQKLASNLLRGSKNSIIQNIAGANKALTSPLITKAVNEEDMTDAEVSEFMGLSSSVPLFDDALTPKEQGGQVSLPSNSNPENFSDLVKRKYFNEQINQYQEDLKDIQKISEQKNAVYQSCVTNYFFQMATLPTNAQIAKAQQNGAWAKNKIKEVLSPSLSTHTKKMLDAAIEDSFFVMPRSQESFHKYFMEKIKAATSDLSDSTRDYAKFKKNGQNKSSTLLYIHLDSDNYKINKHFSEAQSFCDKFKIQYIHDNIQTSTGGIEISWSSVRDPEFGKPVMLHELGHLTFENLNSEKASAASREHFQKVKQCLSDNHPNDKSGGHYVNEDWGDLIAGKGSDRNAGCVLSDQVGNNYVDLNFGNPNVEDPHSSAFFRALHFHKLQNGKLPSACNQYAESQGQGWNFKSCL